MCRNETTKMTHTGRKLIIFTYTLIITLISVAIFLYGFFPVKYNDNVVAKTSNIPHYVGRVRIKKDDLYRPVAKKIIFMVIDALRWDFVTGAIGNSAMPVTSQLINMKSTCLMQAKSDPPTVTMPRIKAMMTGGVPSFVDVALNFGNSPISGDSLLLQAKNQGHKIHFYGDDTWLKIFPGMFDRHEGTTSFYVNDFTEVDNNVTRHLTRELENKDDWSLLILHYLGLDHIGHVAGPFSPLVRPKLREMDNIIGQIQGKIENWNENGLPAIFVICGDHGMKDTGGHGGSTNEETLVPFFVIGASCSSNINEPNRVSQVDIASTLSMFLGTPIPSTNIGSIPLYMLNDRSDSSKLFVLYYNSQQILKHFEKLPNYESSQAYKYYKKAIELHIQWLTIQQENYAVDPVLNLYDKAFQNMKESLIQSTICYDIHTMTIAMIFMAHIVYTMVNCQNNEVEEKKNKYYWIIGSIISYFILRFFWNSENVMSAENYQNFPLNIIAIWIVVINSNLAGNMSLSPLKKVANLTLPEFLFLLGMIAHITSLSSSSFVEEEHQTWYFFWTTFLILLVFVVMRNRYDLRLGIKIILCLLAHRILRKLNSTGNKYAHLPDIGNWLRDQENSTAMTSLLLSALGLLLWTGWYCEEKKYKIKSLIMHVGAAICIYLRHMASNNVAKLPFYFESRGIVEVRIFWIVVTFYCLHWTHRIARTGRRKYLANLLFRFIVQLWIVISAILHRPHNVVLLPVQVLASCVIHDVLRDCNTPIDAYIYTLMGNVFYFYQGNSNSLATIDVGAGYVGMESYNPVVTGIFLSINTYTAPVLSYLILIYRSVLREEPNSYSEKIFSVNKNCALLRYIPLAVYTIIVTIQRFHLFIWTVFSPKLLYEAMYCAVMFIIILTMQLLGYCLTTK